MNFHWNLFSLNSKLFPSAKGDISNKFATQIRKLQTMVAPQSWSIQWWLCWPDLDHILTLPSWLPQVLSGFLFWCPFSGRRWETKPIHQLTDCYCSAIAWNLEWTLAQQLSSLFHRLLSGESNCGQFYDCLHCTARLISHKTIRTYSYDPFPG